MTGLKRRKIVARFGPRISAKVSIKRFRKRVARRRRR